MIFIPIDLIASPSDRCKQKKCVVRKVTQNDVANNAYDALMKRNAKVIFLDMPQSSKLQTKFPGQRINV